MDKAAFNFSQNKNTDTSDNGAPSHPGLKLDAKQISAGTTTGGMMPLDSGSDIQLIFKRRQGDKAS